MQAYLASLDAAHLYWDGVSSLSDYLLSIGVRKEGVDELVEILEAGHPGLLKSISVEDWVMGFLAQTEEEDKKVCCGVEVGGRGRMLIGGRSMRSGWRRR